jgi:hypothetical protein
MRTVWQRPAGLGPGLRFKLWIDFIYKAFEPDLGCDDPGHLLATSWEISFDECTAWSAAGVGLTASEGWQHNSEP